MDRTDIEGPNLSLYLEQLHPQLTAASEYTQSTAIFHIINKAGAQCPLVRASSDLLKPGTEFGNVIKVAPSIARRLYQEMPTRVLSAYF